MTSIQLRQLIDNILEDTSRDMREQCDTVDVAFQKRVTEMEDAKKKMEENLKKVMMQCKVCAKTSRSIVKPLTTLHEPMQLFSRKKCGN